MASFGDLNRVNTNIQSLDSQLSLNRINKNLAENQMRLSTGLRINRAEDDAAGYSIATKLNSRVAGLEQALSNVGDAKSVLDIAEASFDQVMDSLIEMKALATQASNDTLGAEERGFISQQIEALGNDINEIANQTVFQDFALLNGADGNHTGNLSLTFQVGERAADTLTTDLAAVNVSQLFTGSDAVGDAPDATGQVSSSSVQIATESDTGTSAAQGVYEFDLDLGDAASGTVTIDGVDYTFGSGNDFENLGELADAITADGTYSASALNGTITLTEETASGSDLAAGDISVDLLDGDSNGTGGVSNFDVVTESDEGTPAVAGEYTFDITTAFEEGETITIGGDSYVMGTDFSGESAADQAASLAGAISFAGHSISADGNTITFTEDTADGSDPTIAIDTEGFAGGQGSLSLTGFEADQFRSFIGDIDTAISSMSQRVNDIGIAQSSLSVREVTLSQSISANSSAVSRIMDADFAKEQSDSVRLQILQQTATSALAQANFGPQSVLGFLG